MSTIRYFEGRYPHPYLLLLPLTPCILLSLPYFSFFTSSPLFRIPFPSPLTYNLYHSHALSSCTAYSPSSYMSHNPPPCFLLFSLSLSLPITLSPYLHPSPPHLTQSPFNLVALPDSWPVLFFEGLSYISSNQIQESALGSHVNSIPVHHLCGSNTAREGKCEVAVLVHGALGLPMKSDGRVPQPYIVGWVVETTEWLVKEQ